MRTRVFPKTGLKLWEEAVSLPIEPTDRSGVLWWAFLPSYSWQKAPKLKAKIMIYRGKTRFFAIFTKARTSPSDPQLRKKKSSKFCKKIIFLDQMYHGDSTNTIKSRKKNSQKKFFLMHALWGVLCVTPMCFQKRGGEYGRKQFHCQKSPKTDREYFGELSYQVIADRELKNWRQEAKIMIYKGKIRFSRFSLSPDLP